MPYDNRKLGENPLTRSSSKDWDLWSIGMISLEVIVGSDLVLTLTTQEAVESLMADIRPHIPTTTHRLLTEMLFFVKDEHAVSNAKGDYFDTIYNIKGAINGIEAAKVGNSIIKQRVDAFQAAAIDLEEELALKHGWEPNLEII